MTLTFAGSNPVCPHDAPAYNTAQPGELAEWGGRRAGGIKLFINIITFITTTQAGCLLVNFQ